MDPSSTAGLPDGVHAQLGGAHVHCPYPQLGRQEWTDRGATTGVISNQHFLRVGQSEGNVMVDGNDLTKSLYSGTTLMGMT